MSEKYLSPTDYLLTNVNGRVLTITLNRPDALNSIRPEMLDGIRKLIVNTENDENISEQIINKAVDLAKLGVDVTEISNRTGLSEEQIETLIKFHTQK